MGGPHKHDDEEEVENEEKNKIIRNETNKLTTQRYYCWKNDSDKRKKKYIPIQIVELLQFFRGSTKKE